MKPTPRRMTGHGSNIRSTRCFAIRAQKVVCPGHDPVPGQLGLAGDGFIDAVNLKCDPLLVDAMRREPGFFPAYHMNKTHWITAALDGSADDEKLRFILEMSYDLTKPKTQRKKSPPEAE